MKNVQTILISARNRPISSVALLSIQPQPRDIEDFLVQREIIITRESIRLWSNKFGSKYVARLPKRHQGYGDTFFIDEVFIKIQGASKTLYQGHNTASCTTCSGESSAMNKVCFYHTTSTAGWARTVKFAGEGYEVFESVTVAFHTEETMF